MTTIPPTRWLDMGPYSVGTWPKERCEARPCADRVVVKFEGFTFRSDPLYLCAEHGAEFLTDAAADLKAAQ